MKKIKTIEFWFDFASTYTYPSIMRIDSLIKNKNIQIIWKPFLLGVVFNQSGLNNSPFNIYPTKGKYMWRDIERICNDNNFSFQKPSIFPRNGLLAARITCQFSQEAWIFDFIKTVFQANFQYDLDISSNQVIANCLNHCKQNPNSIINKATSQESKDKLRNQTVEALEKEIFGAPSFITNNELFWGNDRLEQAIHWRGINNN